MDSVRQEVRKIEKKNEEQSLWAEEKLRIPLILLGGVIYSIGVNLFLRPLHLYSGGIMGFSQLVTTLLKNAGILSAKVDLAGVLNYLLNLPGLILAVRTMRKRFALKTILSLSITTFLLTLIPIPVIPIMEEKVANCVVAGILAGIGSGLILRAGASGGGMDLIGMIVVQKFGHFSVGTVNVAANVILYSICLIIFDVPTAIYSMINSVIQSTACDRVHTQNINVEVKVITKLKDTGPLEIAIMGSTGRGLTRLSATGRYSEEDESVFIMVISKYEIPKLLAVIREHDPSAFILLDENIRVEGHFIRKLT
ncbi:MAG: YitT family protein [Lachnospiraceae bacterium]|nr:YitT family protein [Lachnospiraceae bacterium]